MQQESMTEAPEATATAPASEAANVQSDTAAQQQVPAQAPVQEPAEQPAAEQETAPQGAPEKYNFSLPEGFEVDSASMGEFEGTAREANLTQEQAQKLVEFEARRVAELRELYQQQIASWEQELRQDREFGGSNFDKNMDIALKTQADFGTPVLKDILKTSGLGSHPEVVRFFHRVGQQLGEGAVHRTTSEVPAEKTAGSLLWPNLPN